MAHRLGHNPTTPQYAGLTETGADGHTRFNGTVRFVPEVLDKLKHWRKPRRVFVCSMSDLFHEGLKDRETLAVLNAMAAAPQHTYQLLTKRPWNMVDLLRLWGRLAHTEEYGSAPIPPNWWMGVTICNQAEADAKIPHLLKVPAKVRWLSVEPMLGPVDLSAWFDAPNDYCPAHDYGDPGYPPAECSYCRIPPRPTWLVVGGETGPHARPVDPWWVVDLYRQCEAAGAPFFAKKFPHVYPSVDLMSAGGQADWYTALETREYPEVTA
jgi:protein gp37